MDDMFNGAEDFNGQIDEWKVSNVKSMIRMFKDAKTFNQDISGWDLSNVTRSDGFADGATSFVAANQPNFN